MRKFLLSGVLLNFAVANGAFAMETSSDNFGFIQSHVQNAQLTSEQINESLQTAGAIEVVVSPTPLGINSPRILCPASQLRFLDGEMDYDNAEFTASFSVSDARTVQITLSMLTIESWLNGSLLNGDERPIIWVKGEQTDKKTYLLIDGVRPRFVGSFEIAKQAYPEFRKNDELEKSDSSTLKTAKENAVRFKVEKFGAVDKFSALFVKDSYDPFSNELIKIMILDDADKLRDFLLLSDIGTFSQKSINGLRCNPMQFAALCGSVKCLKYLILSGGETNESLAPFAVAGGSLEIIRILEQKEIKLDNSIDWSSSEFVNMDVVRWLFFRPAQGDNQSLDDKEVFLNACRSGRLDILLYLADQYGEGDIKTYVGGIRYFETPLHVASQNGHLDIVEYLVEECHCNVEARDSYNRTPLHYASTLDIVKYLVEECHANVEAKDSYNRTPLHIASEEGHLDIVEYLVEECHCNVEARDSYNRTPLHYASTLDIVKYLIEECQCNAENSFHGDRNELEWYIESKVNSYIEAKDNRGRSAADMADLDRTKYYLRGYWKLLRAAKNGNFNEVKDSVNIENSSSYMSIGDKDGMTLLHYASERGQLDIVKYLFEDCYCNIGMINAKSKNGATPLSLAIEKGHLDVITYFAGINNKGLLSAAGSGNLSIVKHLVEECHANVEVKDNYGETPLHAASQEGHLDIVKYLIEECHCDVEARDKYGYTPLHQAARQGHLGIVKYLVEECHANVEAKIDDVWTPLRLASDWGHLNIVKYLVEECHCDVAAENNNIWSALRFASERGHLDIVKYFVEECHTEITDRIIDKAKSNEIKDYLRGKHKK